MPRGATHPCTPGLTSSLQPQIPMLAESPPTQSRAQAPLSPLASALLEKTVQKPPRACPRVSVRGRGQAQGA